MGKETAMSYGHKMELLGWLEDCCPYGNEPLRFFRFTEHEDGRGKVIFCTGANRYALSFSDGYLGAVASCRTELPGENWTRGSDLPDGDFSRETFDKILRAIVTYELVELAPLVEPITELAEVGPSLT